MKVWEVIEALSHLEAGAEVFLDWEDCLDETYLVKRVCVDADGAVLIRDYDEEDDE